LNSSHASESGKSNKSAKAGAKNKIIIKNFIVLLLVLKANSKPFYIV
jgi:hypothetical protein